MKIVFAHQNFPGQFGSFARYLAGQGCDVSYFTAHETVTSDRDFRIVKMTPHREPTADTHRYAMSLEKASINGQAFAQSAIRMRDAGLIPDVVVAHSGWGSGSFAKAVWPECKFVPYAEWFYRWPPRDATEPTTPKEGPDGRALALSRNAPMLLDLAQADLVFCPTQFQAAQFPERLREKMLVMHDGVDTQALAPQPGLRAEANGTPLPEDAEVVTYATRGIEPHRGFPEFMRALARLQRRRPKLHAIIGGEDRVAYGRQLPDGDSWKSKLLAELDLDLERVHFTGLLPRDAFTRLMQTSHVHVYLTVPFVLSWSLVEAMSIGCPLVASDTEPVREALRDGLEGDLVDHGNVKSLSRAIERLLDDRKRAEQLGAAARARAGQLYDTNWIHPARAFHLQRLVEFGGGS